MSLRRPDRSGTRTWWCVPAVALLAAVVTGCAPSAGPTPIPTIIPTTTPRAAPRSSVSAEVNIYLMMVAPVTTDYAILYARDQPVRALEALVKELDLIEPPPEMVEAHALLREGYQLLVQGTTLLQSNPDAVLRSEAIFIQDWGVRQLWEHRRLVAEYQSQAADELAP